MATDPSALTTPTPAQPVDVLGTVATLLAAHRTDIEALVQTQLAAHQQDILAAVGTQLRGFKLTPMTQQIIALAAVAAILIGALGVLFSALAGNHTAQDWIAGVPIAIGSLVLLASKLGV